MKNFVQDGHTLSLTAPYAVSSGDGMLVGSLFAVAVTAAAINKPVQVVTCGVFELPKLNTDTIDEGQLVYWDNTNKRVTETASGNYSIGAAIAAAGNGATKVKVRLDGITTAAAS